MERDRRAERIIVVSSLWTFCIFAQFLNIVSAPEAELKCKYDEHFVKR